jgi:hypothetical protein
VAETETRLTPDDRSRISNEVAESCSPQQGQTIMAMTGADRMRAHRARRRRRVRKLTIGVSEDDLRAVAERDYEGAVSTDHDQEAQAVALFLNDALNPRPILVSLSPSGASFRVGRADIMP